MTEEDEEDHLRPLGRVVVAAGRLEYAAYAVAVALGVGNATGVSVKKALKAARRRLAEDPPPWTDLTTAELDRWRADVTAALEERNRLFHAAQTNRATGDAWVRVHLRLRDGSDVDATPAVINDLADKLHGAKAASPLRRLCPEIAPGVHAHLVRAPGFEAGFTIYYDSEDGWPQRPTGDEVVRLWAVLPLADKFAWQAWLDRLVDSGD